MRRDHFRWITTFIALKKVIKGGRGVGGAVRYDFTLCGVYRVIFLKITLQFLSNFDLTGFIDFRITLI